MGQPRHSLWVTPLSPSVLRGMGSFLEMWMIHVGSRIKTLYSQISKCKRRVSTPVILPPPQSQRSNFLFSSFWLLSCPPTSSSETLCLLYAGAGWEWCDCWQPGSFILLIFWVSLDQALPLHPIKAKNFTTVFFDSTLSPVEPLNIVAWMGDRSRVRG